MITRIRNKTKKHSKLTLPIQSIIALTLGKGNVNIMGKSLLLAASLTFLCTNLFGQSINSVTVSPQDPTSNDEVNLVINGDRWSTDVEITNIAVVQNFNTWTVDITFESSGEVGLPVTVAFDTIVSLGYMTIGYYDCMVNGIMNSAVQDFDGTSWAVLEPVGIGEPHLQELKFNCTPNPFTDEAILNISVPTTEKVSIKLYDVLGQEVRRVMDQPFKPGVIQWQFASAQLPAGRYYFHVSSGGETIVYSVLKK